MTLTELKEKIGEGVFNRINQEAENEVVLAIQMPLIDQWKKEQYYRERFMLPNFLEECRIFQEKGLTILPVDIFHILFKSKILFASKTEKEYEQRSGGHSFDDFFIPWSARNEKIDVLIDRYLNLLEKSQEEKVLYTEISSFKAEDIRVGEQPPPTPQSFFDGLFQKLNTPLYAFFDGSQLVEKHKDFELGLSKYDDAKAKNYFRAPSFGHKVFGSELYCYFYSSAWLRTFLNLLRVAGYVYPGQMNFGSEKVEFKAPTSPAFLGTHSWGSYSWNENEKEPWVKCPDGCLFLSFGYRGIADMWLDIRTFGGIEKFFIQNIEIFRYLKNPWSLKNVNDVMPTMEILSSATQMPDLGAKILQIYCCLEHMFVPKNVDRDNKKYIVGGINALKPELLPWFNDLYKLRCTYAHKGFVLKDNNTHSLIINSMQNIMTLLISKLKLN